MQSGWTAQSSELFRRFALSRMSKVAPTGESFQFPENFDPEALLHRPLNIPAGEAVS